MAKKAKVSKFEEVRQGAQLFTIASAVLAGIAWAVSLTGESSDLLTAVSSTFMALTMFGGLTMGALYAMKALKLQK